MSSLAVLGEAVGEYSGHGQGELEDSTQPEDMDEMDEDGDYTSDTPMDTSDTTNDTTSDAKPLYIFFDIETTGLSIYDDHVTEIAAKVVGLSLSHLSSPSFSSLVHTPRNISSTGMTFSSLNVLLYSFV